MIFAIDVGSTIPKRGGAAFAWSAVDDAGSEVCIGTCPENLVNEIAGCFNAGESVSLGIEAPLFIPIPKDKANLSKGRANERDRSWAAPAGGYVAALAVHQCAWILKELRLKCGGVARISADPKVWYERTVGEPVLFCWEAFVSGPAHAGHAEDARTAAMYFQAHQANLHSAVTAENPLSLFGAAVLWSGWSNDAAWLSKSMVVLRPEKPWVRVK